VTFARLPLCGRVEASISASAILIAVRVLVNFMLRKETWFVHAIAADAKTPISPILPVGDWATLIRLLRYVGATEADIGRSEPEYRLLEPRQRLD
jgi:hypothetical protein